MQKGERRFSINRKFTSIFPVRLVRGANDGGDKPESKPNARKMRFVKIRGDSRFIFFIGPKKPTSLGFPCFSVSRVSGGFQVRAKPETVSKAE